MPISTPDARALNGVLPTRVGATDNASSVPREQRLAGRPAFSPDPRPPAAWRVVESPVAPVDPPRPSGTWAEMYHDVGMHRDKPFEEVARDLVGMLSVNAIRGRTPKGAQVSANAGPTNWFGSAATIRLRQSVDEAPNLMIDTNSPASANWYGTMHPRVPFEFDRSRASVIVNGDTAAEADARRQQLQQALGEAGIEVPVTTIGEYLQERSHEMASHLPAGEREPFVRGFNDSPLWARKAVGALAARISDDKLAQFRQDEVPALYLHASQRMATELGAEGPALAAQFLQDADRLSEAEQIALADHLRTPYKYGVETLMDGYTLHGTGLRTALDRAHAAQF